MNNVVLAGRLTSDPELRTTSSGLEYVKLSIAVKRDYSKDGSQESDFINITAWRKTAVFINQYFSKGDGIVLSGRIQTGSYQTSSGEKRYTTEVVVDCVEFPLGKKSGNNQPSNPTGIPNVPAAGLPQYSPSVASLPENDVPLPIDNDLPF